MKKIVRISELRLGEFFDKKCQQARGEKWEEEKGGSLSCFLFPSHRSPLSFSPLPSFPSTQGGLGGRGGVGEEKTLKMKTLDLESGVKYSDETELTTFDIKIRKRNQFGNELTKTRKCD